MKLLILIAAVALIGGCMQNNSPSDASIPFKDSSEQADAFVKIDASDSFPKDASFNDAPPDAYVPCDPMGILAPPNAPVIVCPPIEGCYVKGDQSVCLPTGYGTQLSECYENHDCYRGYQCVIPYFSEDEKKITKCGEFCDPETGKTSREVSCKDLPNMEGEGRCVPISYFSERDMELNYPVGVCTKCSEGYYCPKGDKEK